VEGQGTGIEGRGLRIEDRGSRIEGRGSRIEGRGSRVEGGEVHSVERLNLSFGTLVSLGVGVLGSGYKIYS
jgi:hypothetical protein